MKILYATIASCFLALTIGSATAAPKVVEGLDLASYAGRWFEIESTKPLFQKDCVCVTANYTPLDNGKIEVVNTCRKSSVDAPVSSVRGTASPSENPAMLKVSFGFPQLFSNYFVVDLAEDYSWAVVAGRFKNPIWILSRTPSLAPGILEGIRDRLKAEGYKLDSLTPTLQAGCPETLPSIVETASNDGRFATLVAALKATGLDKALEGPGPFTVLAPLDSAFAALGADAIADLLAKPEVLSNILLYHVVSGTAADAATVMKLQQIEMANGKTVNVRLENGKLFINDAQVIVADIKTSNGIIHAIDKVLIP